MDKELAKKYFLWAIVAAIILASFFVLKDFIIALITAVVLAFLLKPIHLKLSKIMPKKLSAFLTILTVLLLIIIVIVFVTISLTNELIKVVESNYIDQIIQKIEQVTKTELKEYLSPLIKEATKFLLELVSNTVSKIPNIILILFVTVVSTYYFLLEWEELKKKLLQILPFNNKKIIIEEIGKTAKQIVVVTLFIAVIEAVIASIGFYLLGIKFAIILGFLIGLFAFIPALGPSAVWVPLALIKLAVGEYPVALGVLIIGLIVGVFVDFWLRIKLAGKKTAIHPVVMLIGLIGGIKLFGLVGFILGPLILNILITFIKNLPNTD